MTRLRYNKLSDFTRWNRAGLQKFQYVDGDAAVWLEELRLAAMGMYARDADIEDRLPETWRYRFNHEKEASFSEVDFINALDWKSLYQPFPDKPETARTRNKRLLAQYAKHSDDYSWEIMRAASRAAHILLGHLDAYSNEGYIRTATQWQNVARLAGMVNHQPSPAASATTTVGLLTEPTDDEKAIEINRGLAMKYTPPEGGAPIVYETLAAIKVHSDLNECRAHGWDRDPSPLSLSDTWLDDTEANLAPGSYGVLEHVNQTGTLDAILLTDISRDKESATADITLSQKNGTSYRGDVVMHVEAKDIRKALPRSTTGNLAIKIDTASSYSVFSPIRLHYDGGYKQMLVLGNADGHLTLQDNYGLAGSLDNGEEVSVETLVPVTNTGSDSLAPGTLTTQAFFMKTDGSLGSGTGVVKYVYDADDNKTDQILGISFQHLDSIGSVYVTTEGAKRETATVVGKPDNILPGSTGDDSKKIATFSGKPPKGLAIGSLFIKRKIGETTPQGLRVVGMSKNENDYSLQFEQNLTSTYNSFQPNEYEFHGPMARTLRPINFNRNPLLAFDGAEITLNSLNDNARELLRLGKQCLIEDELNEQAPLLANLVEAVDVTGAIKLVLEPDEGLAGFKKGWTKINFNAVSASHGETNSPKVLGSGDAEKPLQRFHFKSKDVSFIPSNVAEVGFAPDIDVSVDDVIWPYRDLIDPTATDTDSYSIAVNEDSSLTVFFRRRLPTGTNNIVVKRYRTGVGSKGMVPENAFTKPMKKHRYVEKITQPFAATGGAEREPIEDIRTNAPARLAANGRAVSLKDFERLSVRRSDIWQAKAKAITDPRLSEQIRLIVVPAEGGVVGPTQKIDLLDYIQSRAIPGVRVLVEDYTAIKLLTETTIRVDNDKYDKTQIQANAQATLIETFSLQNRTLGQPVYISEISAALERVEGVATATVQSFSVPDASLLLRTSLTNGSPSAYFPKDNQVISAQSVSAITDFTVAVEAL